MNSDFIAWSRSSGLADLETVEVLPLPTAPLLLSETCMSFQSADHDQKRSEVYQALLRELLKQFSVRELIAELRRRVMQRLCRENDLWPKHRRSGGLS